MALGEQFKDTYWHDDKGEIWSSTHRPINEGSASPPLGVKPSFKTIYLQRGFASDAQRENRTYQGMLFSPETATGTSRDPLLKPGEYRAAAQKALGWGGFATFRPLKDITMLRNTETGAEVRFGPEHHGEFGSSPRHGQEGDVGGARHVAVPGKAEPHESMNSPVAGYRAYRTDRPNMSWADAEKEFEGLLAAVEQSHIPISHLRDMARELPFAGPTVQTDSLRSGVGGDYNPSTGAIRVRSEGPGISQHEISTTLVHELGHKRHLRMGGVSTAGEPDVFGSPDPVKEGVADAYGDRYSDTPRLLSDIPVHMQQALRSTGYSTGFWKNKRDADIYAATRAIAAEQGDVGRDSIPSRADLFQQAHGHDVSSSFDGEGGSDEELKVNQEAASSQLLGHLQSSSRTARRAIGKSDVAREARKQYKADREKSASPKPQQLRLF